MSRELLFRGKRTDNGEWVEGYFVKGEWYFDKKEIYALLPLDLCFFPRCEISEWVEVDPKTVCQYTGLIDKDGNKIFEGDIVKFKHGGEFHDRGIWYRNYAIEYVNTFHTYGLRFRNQSIHFACKKSIISMHDVEVIGNIFDNPELLEVGE